MSNPICYEEGNVERNPIENGVFVRAWLKLAKLPGGMMSGPKGQFGPIGAFTSCAITTSETFRDEWVARGEPFIEVWMRPSVDHCMCEACKGGALHRSDCAVHNEPAYPRGECDCAAWPV